MQRNTKLQTYIPLNLSLLENVYKIICIQTIGPSFFRSPFWCVTNHIYTVTFYDKLTQYQHTFWIIFLFCIHTKQTWQNKLYLFLCWVPLLFYSFLFISVCSPYDYKSHLIIITKHSTYKILHSWKWTHKNTFFFCSIPFCFFSFLRLFFSFLPPFRLYI